MTRAARAHRRQALKSCASVDSASRWHCFVASLVGYNCRFFALRSARRSDRIMDAERINAVEYALDDLDQRAAELRRYL